MITERFVTSYAALPLALYQQRLTEALLRECDGEVIKNRLMRDPDLRLFVAHVTAMDPAMLEAAAAAVKEHAHDGDGALLRALPPSDGDV